jgi:hypothetical protein
MMGAYTDNRVFSINLVGAVSRALHVDHNPKSDELVQVLRQALFVKKMVDLGWTEIILLVSPAALISILCTIQ